MGTGRHRVRPVAFSPFVFFAVLLSAHLHAQAPIRAEGRVVRVGGGDTVGVPGARVVLHQVGRQTQGPRDSVRADRIGRFRFRFPVDTGSIYLLSARFAGIEYFSPPVHTNPSRPDTAITVFVYDTSSTAPIDVDARHLVISSPTEDGTRKVLDLIVLRNSSDETRVASDTVQPSWTMPFPREAIGLNVGEGDFSPEAVTRRGDTLTVFAPLAPGTKQLAIQYSIAADVATLTVPFGSRVETANVLLEEKHARIIGGTLAPADTQRIQGTAYHRWTGTARAGTVLRIALPAKSLADKWLLAGLVGLIAVALGAGAWRILQRQPRPLFAPADPTASLIDEVARLDAEYLGREAEVSSDEWRRYRTEREQLIGRLGASAAPNRSTT